MNDSRTQVPLTRTFLWILAGLGGLNSPGCGTASSSVDGCDPPLETRSYSRAVDTARLRAALEDGAFSQSECLELCRDEFAELVEACSIHVSGSPVSCAATGEAATGEAGAGGSAATDGAGTGNAAAGACDGSINVDCVVESRAYCEGRRHAGWRPGSARAVMARELQVGHWYARAAANEAGSVRSFRLLARELRNTSLGRRYDQRLRRAASDEIRHARAMRAAAQQRGATLVRNEFRAVRARSLLEIALENAREGCVEETYAALIAQVQAVRLSAPEARRCLGDIAEDETRHAELAWELHFAMRDELAEAERIELDTALRRFIDELRNRTTWTMPAELAAELGLPDARSERTLRHRLASALHARC